MANMNKIIIAGQLGADAVLKYTSAGKPVMELSVATAEEWIDSKSGKVMKRTQWHKVVYWGGKHAEALVNKLKLAKGDSVLVEGMMEYSSYPIKKKDKIDLPIEIDIPTAKIKATEVQLLRHVQTKKAQDDPEAAASEDTGIPVNEDQQF